MSRPLALVTPRQSLPWSPSRLHPPHVSSIARNEEQHLSILEHRGAAGVLGIVFVASSVGSVESWHLSTGAT